MNAEMFDRYIATRPVPTLKKGDVVIPDNLSGHRSPGAARALKQAGAWFRFQGKPSPGRFSFPSNLPLCSPGPNPVEMAFSKLKALLRKAAARACDDPWQAAGHMCNLFTEAECRKFFRAAGYGTD